MVPKGHHHKKGQAIVSFVVKSSVGIPVKSKNGETFATLDVICDGMNLLCFVDRRLQMKYHQRLQIPTSSSNETVNGNFDEFSSRNEEDEMKDIMAAIRKTIGPSSYNLSMQKKINGEEASTVFKQHRNLSLICPTIIKSKNYGSDHNLLQMHCIQLFCHRKGYIPLGENHFPSTINGLPTDILQGYGFFASTTLRIGDKIGNKTTCGTLGGFYRFGGKLKCFLTCAHVLYSLSTLLAPKDDMCQNEEVDVFLDPVQSSPRVCGSAIRGVFKHDDSSRTSVDAGIVMIESPDFIIDPSDILRVINGPPQSPSVLVIFDHII
ncbi:hypothetical protein AM593_03721, partial [Mytilus galloprovincialis]